MVVGTLEQASSSKRESEFLEKGLLADKLESLKKNKSLSGLSAIIIDSMEPSRRFDVFDYIRKIVFHLGAVTIATTLAEAGVDTKAIYETVTPNINYETISLPDIVGVSSIITNIDKANSTIKMFNEREAFVVAGGAAYEFTPEIALNAGADVVIHGDGEYTILSLIERLQEQRKAGESIKDVFKRATLDNLLDDILGLYYLKDRKIQYTGEAKLIKNLDESPMPDFGLIERKDSGKGPISKCKSIMASMGCIHKCNFCSVRKRNLDKYRVKSPSRMIAEVEKAIDEGYKDAFIIDDYTLGNLRGISELCDAIIDKNLKFRWSTQTTVKSVINNPDTISLMRKAGCRTLEIGIESIYDDVLKYLGKDQTQEDIITALRIARESDMYVHAMMIIPPDLSMMSMERVEETARFLVHHKVRTAQFCSEGPIPGSDGYKKQREEGIIIDTINGEKIGYRYHDGQHVISSATPYECQMNLIRAYELFYSWPNIIGSFIEPFRKLYHETFHSDHNIMRSFKDSLRKMSFETFGWRVISHALVSSWKFANRDYINGLKTGNIEYLPKS